MHAQLPGDTQHRPWRSGESAGEIFVSILHAYLLICNAYSVGLAARDHVIPWGPSYTCHLKVHAYLWKLWYMTMVYLHASAPPT